MSIPETTKPIETEPILRRFESKDQKAVYALHIKALKHAGTFIETPDLRKEWDKDLEDVEGVYLKNRGEFYVVEIANEIVAMGALRKVDDTTAEIKRMRTEPSMQGRGLGKLILDKLIGRAKELGYKKLVLDVAERQQAARHLYETRGLREYKKGKLGGQETYYQLSI